MRMITGDELLLSINRACSDMEEHGTEPSEIVIDAKYREALEGAKLVAIPFDEMTLFGLSLRFDNLPEGVLYIVS